MTGRLPILLLMAATVTGCGQGLGDSGSSSSPIRVDAETEIVACRARIDDGHRFAEIVLRDLRNLGLSRVTDLAGPELRARIHPDNVRLVFARQRTFDSPDSRELFVATVDGSAAEQRLTQNALRDDQPCWSPNGDRILFASERNGAAGLWLMNADGSSPAPFLPVPSGHADGEADWHRGLDRVVWSRRDPTGHHYLCLVAGNGTGAVQLTDGGAATGPDSGDRDPAFTPDGSAVLFVRRTAADQAALCSCAIATGVVSVLHATVGELSLPRVLPQGDRLLFGLAEPTLGRPTRRLAMLPIGGGTPVLVWPDERWQLEGIDVLPAVPPAPAAAAPVRLDVEDQAEVQIAYAGSAFGTAAQLREDDDFELYLLTKGATGGRQVAGINVRYDLPLAAADDVLELRVRARVRQGRVDPDCVLRMSVFNPSDSRFDTVFEATPASTDEQTMEFRTSSLRHVTQQKQFRVTVVFDLSAGDPADCWVDLVDVEMVTRQTD